jgi:hypothetical protein
MPGARHRNKSPGETGLDPRLVELATTICAAIGHMRVLAFTYDGERRLAEPYIFGMDARGTFVLSAVQRSGGSGRGFRSFHADGLSSVEITERKFFGGHPAYNPEDPYFARILCQVRPRR